MRTITIAAIIPFLLAMQAGRPDPAPVHILRTSELTATPQGERLGVLLTGIPVTRMEEQGKWVHVRIEGWILREDLTLPAAGMTPEKSVLPPTPAPAVSKNTRLEGSIFVTNEGRTEVGLGTTVLLLTAPEEMTQKLAQIHGRCDTRHTELVETAAHLRKVGGKALKGEDATKAWEAYDKAKWARHDILKDLARLDKDCAHQVDTLLTGKEIARTLSSSEGHFLFTGVEPGNYLLHAQFDTDKKRFGWSVPVVLEAGGSLTLDLTNANLSRTSEQTIYK